MSSYTKKKIIAKVAPILSGLGVHKLFSPVYSGLGHILTFHRVLPPSSRPRIHNHLSLEISPSQLEATIQFYKKSGYTFISLDQLHAYLKSGTQADKIVVFTFDDGYRDNLTVAYPILKKHRIPFTIYVTTNFPDYKAILWWYLLEEAILEKSAINFQWQGVDHQIVCKTTNEKETAFDRLRTMINQSFTVSSHEDLLCAIFCKNPEDLFAFSKDQVLSWSDIKKLSEDPLCTIGAHTVNHYPLSQLDEQQLHFEITSSKQKIEDHIGQVVEHFAYPFGKVKEASTREFKVVKSSGFKTGTTTRMGNIFSQHVDALECLPRISVNKVTNTDVLNLQSSGLLPFLMHRGKKVITD